MKTPAAAPYLLPPDSIVTAGPWTDEEGSAIGDRLAYWDPFTDLSLVREVEIDTNALRSHCRLGDDSAFALAASWASTKTRIAGHGPTVELGKTQGLLRAALSVAVPARKAGGRLNLHTRLVLRHPGREPSPISPRRQGATLWAEDDHVALEGGASRFPIAVADFSEHPRYPGSAAWVLEWDADDLDAPVLGGMRLLVNGTHDSLLQSLRTGTTDSRSAAVRSFVIFDAARTLIVGALQNERFIDNPEAFPDGSVGRMIFELLALCWPGVPAIALFGRSKEDPARFSAELQAYFGVIS